MQFKKGFAIFLVSLFMMCIFTLTTVAFADSITITRSGSSYNSISRGNVSFDDYLYDSDSGGIRIGDGIDSAKIAYEFLLPYHTHDSENQISSIIVSVRGQSNFSPNIIIADQEYEISDLNGTETLETFHGQSARNILAGPYDRYASLLVVEIEVGPFAAYLDLKEISVEYEYLGVPHNTLQRFHEAYSSFRAINEYESRMVTSLWNTEYWSAENHFYPAVRKTMALADNLSGLSGSLYNSLKTTNSCIAEFEGLAAILESSFDSFNFWRHYALNGGPSVNQVYSALIHARDSFNAYAQHLFDLSFGGDITPTDIAQINLIIDDARTKTSNLREIMRNVAQESWFINKNYDDNGGGNTAQIMLYSLAPLLNISYDINSHSSEPSYLSGIVDGLTLLQDGVLIYSITSSSDLNGSIDPEGSVAVAQGGNRIFNASPDSGYEVYQWIVDGLVEQEGGNIYIVQNVQSDTTISVTFNIETDVTEFTASDGDYPDKVVLSWPVFQSEGPYNVYGYSLYRNGDTLIDSPSTLNTISPTITSYVDEIDIEPGVVYNYTLGVNRSEGGTLLGTHLVSFHADTGYADLNTGSLTVSLTNQDANDAGAQWALTSGPDTTWQNNGQTISRLAPGDYVITFREISGFTNPSPQAISISSGNSLVSYSYECIYSGGNGTESNPFTIENINDLSTMKNDSGSWSRSFILTNDIDLADHVFSSAVISPDTGSDYLAYDGTIFEGSFDGGGHTIHNLTINGDSDAEHLGFFGYIGSDGEVINLNLENVNISSQGSRTGGLCGRNQGRISNCFVEGSVVANSSDHDTIDIGGLCGLNYYGTISNSHSNGLVNSNGSGIGGLCGRNGYGSVINSYSTSNVIGSNNIGGLCGVNSNGLIVSCYSIGSVTAGDGSASIGGLCGQNISAAPLGGSSDESTIRNSYSTGNVTVGNDSTFIGGLCGYSMSQDTMFGPSEASTIINSYATGNVSGGANTQEIGGLCGRIYGTTVSNSRSSGNTISGTESFFIGGLVGRNAGPSTIEISFSTGIVRGDIDARYIGGLCGRNEAYIYRCYSSGGVNAGDVTAYYIGGLCGSNSGTISNSYSSSSVEDGRRGGGLCGRNDGGVIEFCFSTGWLSFSFDFGYFCAVNDNGGIINNSYWDVETANWHTSPGENNFGAIGKTTSEMQTQATFTAWDFLGEDENGTNDLWVIQSNQYPHLSWQALSAPLRPQNPLPADNSNEHPIEINLSWPNSAGATSYNVYLGTDYSPDSGEFKVEQEASTYDPGTLEYNKTYYWRIDAKNSAGVIPGNVWSFTTQSQSISELSVNPVSFPANASAGSISFIVDNIGSGTMSWTAAVTNGSGWLSIVSNAFGSNNGTIIAEYSANPSTTPRPGIIRVTAPDAIGSLIDVTVLQAGSDNNDRDGDGVPDDDDAFPDESDESSDNDGDEVGDNADPDDDNDGVNDDTENAGPNNGDGNDDGTADSLQANVTSIRSYGGGDYISLASPAGTSLSNCQAIGNPATDTAPDDIEFPYGFIDFTINGIAADGSTTLTVYFPADAALETYYKHGYEPGNSTDHWYDFMYDGSTGAEINGNVVTLHFIDADRGDDELTQDGMIIDIGGPGVASSVPPDPDPDSGGGGGGGGCFISVSLN